MNTDEEWEKWGQQNPYYGVITNSKFRSANLDESSRIEFFESGRSHVEHVLAVCQRFVDQAFTPLNVLDFGCGVGRLLIPFSTHAARVVGLDVSESMLQEATRNCELCGVKNVVLVTSDDELTGIDETFDLIHSAIVFQHIDPKRGQHLFCRLLAHLAPGGVGAIQITYAKEIYAQTYGVAPLVSLHVDNSIPKTRPTTLKRRGILGMLSGDSASVAVPSGGVAQGTPSTGSISRDPEMQMNSYNLNHLLFMLQQAGVKRFFTEFTDHGGELGVFLFFQKPPV